MIAQRELGDLPQTVGNGFVIDALGITL